MKAERINFKVREPKLKSQREHNIANCVHVDILRARILSAINMGTQITLLPNDLTILYRLLDAESEALHKILDKDAPESK